MVTFTEPHAVAHLAEDAIWFAPGHRRVWDGTCLTDLMDCAQKYEYKRVQGLYPLPRDDQPPVNPHTTFGSLLHAAVESWDISQWDGGTADQCTCVALAYGLMSGWGEDGATPFGGYILDQWTCTGVEYRGATRRRAFLCDAARDWWVGSEVECPHCRRPTQQKTAYVPEYANKNLRSLVRAVIAYEEHRKQSAWGVAEWDNKPALEMQLQARLPGTPYIISGTLDRLSIAPGGQLWVHERKTTALTPGNSWWGSFDMRLQIGLYIWLCQQNGISVMGAILECFHISAATVEIEERTFTRTPGQIAEMLEEVRFIIEGHLAKRLPKRNFAACDHADGGQACSYRRICGAPPDDRTDVIMLNYGVAPLWNPLTATHEGG